MKAYRLLEAAFSDELEKGTNNGQRSCGRRLQIRKHNKSKHGTTKYRLRPIFLYNKYIQMKIINIIYTALFKEKKKQILKKVSRENQDETVQHYI